MSLEIVIASPGMPVGPNTLNLKSLGGSETAALSLAKELKARGHIVTLFTNLPPIGSPDFISSGGIGGDGVRYVSMEHYQGFISATEVDLLIVSRAPELLGLPHQARKAVLWCHDLATYHGPAMKLPEVGWNIDEIWCVTEWHADQYAKVTGYPRQFIKVLRNAITRTEVPCWSVRIPNQLFYAARPERGLEALVRPGGIMSRLPDYRLKVAMYDNFPPHMKGYYNQLFAWVAALPNVELVGYLTQQQVRQVMAESAAYVYPTDFEETSCILAQEAVEVNTPFITTPKGALTETLRGYGWFVNTPWKWNSDEFCESFAENVKNMVECWQPPAGEHRARYWSDAAVDVEVLFFSPPNGHFTKLWSLVEDSDVIPAIALAKQLEAGGTPLSHHARDFMNRVERLYPYLYGRETFAHYYERYFKREDSKGARTRRSQVGNPRFEAIAEQVAKLPAGAVVIDYGCAEGVIILDLAARFRDKSFVGIDFAQSNVELCQKYAEDMGLVNVAFYHGSTDEWPGELSAANGFAANAVICTEVLEHVTEPWTVIGFLEGKVKEGGRVIVTVPAGPWEAIGLYDREQYNWRAHIWHINKWMLRQMFADKKGCEMQSLANGHMPDGRAVGHLAYSYTADHAPVHPVDPLEKALRHRARETVTATIITNTADTLRRTLKSIAQQVQVVRVGITTKDSVDIYRALSDYEQEHPWLHVTAYELPKIAPRAFGFDDARNMLLRDVETDWVLWIDSDEYLSGDFRKYLRRNAFDAYAIHQHHFTCDPRGAPTQLDKPARLFRTDRGFEFYGKVHEHAEKGVNGGPGFAFILPDVDIGHAGYDNESTRRGRFERNWPFMEWDHEVNPGRKIGKFLWLRDIIHRMRYAFEARNVEAARALAEEAVSYYKANWSDWSENGMGGEHAISYYGEALQFLGRGLPVRVQFEANGQAGQYGGVFDSEAEAVAVLNTALKGQFDKRRSPYWG